MRGFFIILSAVSVFLLLFGCGDGSKKTSYLPGKVANPQPAQNALDVPVTAILTWTVSERTDSYDVYFGSGANAVTNATRFSAEFKGNQTDLSYDPPGDLDQSMIYYWRIDSLNSFGTTRGDVWFFMTVLDANAICVDDANGNDNNNGLSWSTAVKTVQKGLDLASDGWVVLVARGTYKGAGNKSLEFAGKAVRLSGVGGAANCVIDCESDGRAFYFHSGETSSTILEGMTIQNGRITVGGGIRCENSSSPTIRNCVIQSCTAEGDCGGGIYCNNSSPTISGCIIAGNSAGDGGGVYCRDSSNVTITDCTIANNSVSSRGGGVFCSYSDVTISNCEISNNSSSGYDYGGGGICCFDGRVFVISCTITSNSSYWNGGGIYICIWWPRSLSEYQPQKSQILHA